MDQQAIIKELQGIKAHADILSERAERLLQNLPGSSLQGKQKKKKGLTPEQKAEMIAAKYKRLGIFQNS